MHFTVCKLFLKIVRSDKITYVGENWTFKSDPWNLELVRGYLAGSASDCNGRPGRRGTAGGANVTASETPGSGMALSLGV